MVNITRKINGIIKDVRENVIVDNHLLDGNVRRMISDLAENVFISDNVKRLGKHIMERFDSILKANNVDKNERIDNKYFNELIINFPWLLDAIDLRSYFYENIKAFRCMQNWT